MAKNEAQQLYTELSDLLLEHGTQQPDGLYIVKPFKPDVTVVASSYYNNFAHIQRTTDHHRLLVARTAIIACELRGIPADITDDENPVALYRPADINPANRPVGSLLYAAHTFALDNGYVAVGIEKRDGDIQATPLKDPRQNPLIETLLS
jgi:hypothetical protein